MDFMNRVTQNQQPTRVASSPDSVDLPPNRVKAEERHSHDNRHDNFAKWSRWGSNVLLVVVALLIAAVAWLIYSASPTSEYTYVDPSKLQAVFLNTGQVYFGNVQVLNNDYLVLTNVYYLQNNSSSTSSTSSSSNQNVSLVKLGCELHMPYDRMVINTSEVTFWENLQAGGQVAKAVASYQKDHPNGQQNCSQSSTPTSNSTTNPQSSQ
jgi:hypothetical protein